MFRTHKHVQNNTTNSEAPDIDVSRAMSEASHPINPNSVHFTRRANRRQTRIDSDGKHTRTQRQIKKRRKRDRVKDRRTYRKMCRQTGIRTCRQRGRDAEKEADMERGSIR